MGGLYFDENNNLVFSGITTEYVLCAGDGIPGPTPSITPSVTPTLTPSETPSLTPSETPSITPSETPSETPSITPTPSSSEIPISTPSMTPTPTPTIPAPIGFKTEWTTTGANETITLPFVDDGVFNCTVDWGDGSSGSTITSYNDANATHNYVVAGVYIVEIKGDAPSWSTTGSPDAAKLTNIIHWGNSAGFNGFKNLSSGFGGSSITSLGTGKILTTVDHNTGLLAAAFIFNNISSLPNGFLDNCVNITTLSFTFAYTQLSVLPSGIFDNLINLIDIGGIFEGCSLITNSGLPTDFLRYNTALQSVAGAFRGISITYIPDDFFKYNTDLSNFTSAFLGCTQLTGVTDVNLFNWTTAPGGLYAAGVFNGCSNLETIPDGLFINPLFIEIRYIFLECSKLQINPWTFYLNSGDTATRFYDKIIYLDGAFNRSTFTGIQGTAPDLWNCDFGTGSVTSTGCYGGTGNDLTSISNYGDIPAGWL